MSTVADSAIVGARTSSVFGRSLRRNRRWALIASYVFLLVFVVFFLVPPYYMLVTSLKSSAEIASMSSNPWEIGRASCRERV